MLPVGRLSEFRLCLERMFAERVQPYVRETKRQKNTITPRKHFLIICGGVLRVVWCQNAETWERGPGTFLGEVFYPKQIATKPRTPSEWDLIVLQHVNKAELIMEAMA